MSRDMPLDPGPKYAAYPPCQRLRAMLTEIEVAVDRTFPNGRVLGIDIIPAQPPKGVSTIQGNFLSPAVQEEVKRFLRESDRGRAKQELSLLTKDGQDQMTEEDLEQSSRSYLELEKRAEAGTLGQDDATSQLKCKGKDVEDAVEGRMVDVVLSDMSEPWAQTDGFWKRSLSDPYYRMMNTSGVSFRDHAGSMVRSCQHQILRDEADMVYYRVYVTLHYALHSTPCGLAGISSANSIKVQRTKLLSID